jgi:uncharacterized protein (TIGR03083 family)
MAVDLEVRSTKKARKSALDRDVAMTLAATEYDRVVTMFKEFTVEQWAMSTDCPGWDVRAMAGHMLGMAQMVATLPELIRQQATSQRSAKKNGGVSIDSLTALQVAKNANLTAGELVENMRRVAPRAVRGRRRVPAIILNRRMPEAQGVGGQLELWTFGYLFDVILTRDPFMHRLDITQATGVPMRATADHEGVLVDDIVREWAGRHGREFSLELSGPAGGTWGTGTGKRMAMDAFEFCRILAGRKPATGLLAEQVPF